MKIKTLKNIVLGLDIKPACTVLEVGIDLTEAEAQRLIGFGDMVEQLEEENNVSVSQPRAQTEMPNKEESQQETTVYKPVTTKEKAPPPVLNKVFPGTKDKKANKK